MPVLKRLFGTCEIIANKRVIKKCYNDPISVGFFDNEVNWYKKFNDTPTVPPQTPKMIDYSPDTLVLEYVGIPITKDKIPVNFKNQLRQIASFLESHNCYHCDITPDNLLIFETNIFIIDFGWAVEINENPYRKWEHVEKHMLDYLGGIYRAPDWPNDKYSLTKIYREFSGNKKNKLFPEEKK